MRDVSGKTVLIMATDGFEESELTGPRQLLSDAGAKVVIAAPGNDPIQGREKDRPTIKVQPDVRIENVRVGEYDALVLPGGVINPDQLRTNERAVQIIRDFNAAGKPVAAICHGPWLLVEADILEGRRATSWPSIKTDVKNAGAQWVDEEACVDGNLITSRNPDDVAAFSHAISQLLCEEQVAAQ
ncbi:type 1 glutamine amidotransferase domain-containing protein [Sphingomicrobium flavum]|uniref:type 1 glutamine amidotransferase domain-containing protein n=1 Tax=Sphingomicrobium flavum TaxID=1229164 RepID=UPI0021ADF4D4|nr:type 1 glutamine amidotransferase domain-containing protein [Sphingomicrobium flavum]